MSRAIDRRLAASSSTRRGELRRLLQADRARLVRPGEQIPGTVSALVMRPGFLAVALHRVAAGSMMRGGVWEKAAWAVHRASVALTGCDINPGAQIGPGLVVPHPVGLVVGRAQIGRDAMLMQHSTIGLRDLALDVNDPANHPVIGDQVVVGSGAVVAGPITVGDQARIGANAVVLKDVSPNGTVVGNPARVVSGGVDEAVSDNRG